MPSSPRWDFGGSYEIKAPMSSFTFLVTARSFSNALDKSLWLLETHLQEAARSGPRLKNLEQVLIQKAEKCFATTGSSLQSIVLNSLGISFDGSVASWPYQTGYFLKDRLCNFGPG